MNQSSCEIAILSLAQIWEIGDTQISNPAIRETFERHLAQVAAIVQDKPFNQPDDSTMKLIEGVKNLINTGKE